MPSKTAIAVGLLDATASRATPLVDQLTELVNTVYATAERGLWREGTTRTTAAEMAELIAAHQIAVATTPQSDIVGSIRIHDIAVDTSEFGILVSAPTHRGTGVGRALREFVEERSRERGLRAMRLELLVPQRWRHPSKEFLKAWYGRSGYRLVRTGHLGDAYPHLAPLLATPCDVEIHEKPLR
jgi:GNAT superfamily N-acetyltransferase